MSKIWRFLLAVAFMGLIFGFVGLGDTILLIKGDTVNICDPLSSFEEKALVQGDIDFVYGLLLSLKKVRSVTALPQARPRLISLL